MSWQLRQILPDRFARNYTSGDDDDDNNDEKELEYDDDEYDDGYECKYAGEAATDADENDISARKIEGPLGENLSDSMEGDNHQRNYQQNQKATSTGEKSNRQQQHNNNNSNNSNNNNKNKSKSKPNQKRPWNNKASIPKSSVHLLPRAFKHPYDRFFAALLRSPAKDYLASTGIRIGGSDTSNTAQKEQLQQNGGGVGGNNSNTRPSDASLSLWTDICRRVGLKPLLEPILAKYSDPFEHFAVRAALVLEESRHAIADELARRWGSPRGGGGATAGVKNGSRLPRRPKPSRTTMKAQCVQVTATDPDTDRTTLTFRLLAPVSGGELRFSKDQLFALRPGTVMEILPVGNTQNNKASRKTNDTIITPSAVDHHNVILGCMAFSIREEIEREKTFSVTFFHNIPFLQDCGADGMDAASLGSLTFEVTPVTGLISELRQFEACLNKQSHKLLFLDALMGHWPKHIRFEYSDDEDDDNDRGENTAQARLEHSCGGDASQESTLSSSAMSANPHELVAPPLNATQERAAKQFLGSGPGSITLVQGPPGTGKSTLLVSTICRYLLAADSIDIRARLMVSAPTNRAVAVVASRFLKVLREQNNTSYNIIMLGDADKLLDGDTTDSSDDDNVQVQGQQPSHSLRSIFLYSWMSQLIDAYKRLRQVIVLHRLEPPSAEECDESFALAWRLHWRLVRSLPHSTKGEISSLARKVGKSLKAVTSSSTYESDSEDSHTLDIGVIDELIEKLAELPNEDVCRELLQSAEVIFCTLATAGAKLFKWTGRIDDLIVDEASAATEPELYIPFHLKPRRLLVVGDPNQLPATVMSKRAVALGYDKSLHERLMNDCQCSYTMLDIQYRMHPLISAFPAKQFYDNKIRNGPNVLSKNYRTTSPLLCGKPYYFLQADGTEDQAACGSYRNHAEAHRVVDLIQDLRAKAVADQQWHLADRVRIITFYRAQVVLVQQLLSKRGLSQVLVATVDSSQGCEADLVIVSFVRSNTAGSKFKRGASSSHFLPGFLNDDRRMNVALTRAKHQLICVGNVKAMSTLGSTSALFGLASNAASRDCVVVEATGTGSIEFEKKRKLPVGHPFSKYKQHVGGGHKKGAGVPRKRVKDV